MNNTETIIGKIDVYKGKFIDVQVVHVELPTGERGTRDVVRHPGACAVLALKGSDVVMVRQFRTPVEKEILEIPAGKLDEGEEPLKCAMREFEEETGFSSRDMRLLCTIYTTPGFTDEVLHIYYTKDFVKGKRHPDEDEFLDVITVPLNDLLKMVDSGEIKDSKTLIALMKYARMTNQ